MTVQSKDLWSLVLGQPHVDPDDLALAIQEQASQQPLDYRTRLLIRDSVEALRKHWGDPRTKQWLSTCSAQNRLGVICQESFDKPGFASLADRVMEKTDPDDVKQFLRELGTHANRPLRIIIGGSIALILPGYLSRHTEDIDVVDEVPLELRSLHPQLTDLKNRYGLGLAHFQSHYLPTGWEQRAHSLAPFGRLQVFLVDVYDVFLSKLFSNREKDRDDLRVLAPQLDKETLVRRLHDTTTKLRSEDKLREGAEKNWYILFGEPLPE